MAQQSQLSTNGASSQQTTQGLHKFIQDLITNELGEGATTKFDAGTWVSVVANISDKVFLPFVSIAATNAGFNQIAEHARTLDISLDLMQRVHDRVTSLYKTSGATAKIIFARLMNISVYIACLPTTENPASDAPSPQLLAERCSKTAMQVLLAIGGEATLGETQSSWNLLRDVSAECLDVAEELLRGALPYPLRIALFEKNNVKHCEKAALQPSTRNADDFILTNGSQKVLALCTVLEIVIRGLVPGPVLSHLVPLQQRRAKALANKLHDCCASANQSMTMVARLQVLAKISLLSASLPAQKMRLEQIPGSFSKSFLRIRTHEKSNSLLQSADVIISRAFAQMPSKEQLEMAAIILQILRSEPETQTVDWNVAPFLYLKSCIPDFKPHSLAGSTSISLPEMFSLFMMEVSRRRELMGQSDYEQFAWQASLIRSIHEVSPSVNLNIVRREETGLHLVPPLVTTITGLSSQQIQQLLALPGAIADLRKLSGTIAEHKVEGCLIPLRIPIDVMKGSFSSKIAPSRTQALQLLELVLSSRSSLTADESMLMVDLLSKCLSHGDRRMRLASGRCINVCLRLLGKDDSATVFTRMRELLHTGHHGVQETTLITLGLLARSERFDHRGAALYCLVMRLGHGNSVVAGLAYTQIISAAKSLRKTSSQLLIPHLAGISPLVVLQLRSQPNLLGEIILLLGVQSQQFFQMTLIHYLPHLFSRGDKTVLDEVLTQLEDGLDRVLLNYAHLVFSHVFLLDAKECDAAIKFTNTALRSYAEGLTVTDLLRSCAVPLLAEIIIATGAENTREVVAAHTALDRVIKTFATDPELKPRGLGCGDRLYHYMLAILAHFNHKWQEPDGKNNTRLKGRILRGLGTLIQQIGPRCNESAPQLVALLRTGLAVTELSETALATWNLFLHTIRPEELRAHFSASCASFVTMWPSFSPASRQLVRQLIEDALAILRAQAGRGLDLNDVVDLSSITELKGAQKIIQKHQDRSPRARLAHILERCSHDNATISLQSLRELKAFLLAKSDSLFPVTLSKDIFDPVLGQCISTLLMVSSREWEESEVIRSLVYECIGIVGALDPDRCSLPNDTSELDDIVDFSDEEASKNWAASFISVVLMGLFSSTSDMSYQTYLAYSIQQLLRLCGITSDLLNNRSVPSKVRKRWDSFPSHVLEKLPPLITSKYSVSNKPLEGFTGSVYNLHTTYRDWIQHWVRFLCSTVSIPLAGSMFEAFDCITLHRDATVAQHLLPHLVLITLLSDHGGNIAKVRLEITTVLEDQVDPRSASSEDKRVLSTQAIFTILDHLSRWARLMRQQSSSKKSEGKRATVLDQEMDEKLSRVESILDSLDHSLMAQAAFQCKTYARALMNYERHISTISGTSASKDHYYDRLHEIYAQIDEPDGMEGVSTLVPTPSLDHQIRQHETTGNWTAAQTCWEMKLQEQPNDMELHLGLLRCLQNLGHHDTLLNHISGVLSRDPSGRPLLSGFQAESYWSVGAWDKVEDTVKSASSSSRSIHVAKVLLAARRQDTAAFELALGEARSFLGAPLIASGGKSYRQSYDAVLDLHMMDELERIGTVLMNLADRNFEGQESKEQISALSALMSRRLETTLPNFRVHQSLVNLRRTAFSLIESPSLESEIGQSWLISAKSARKAKQWQVAYTAVLHAHKYASTEAFIQSAKLSNSIGEPLRALQELENADRHQEAIEGQSSTLVHSEDFIEIMDGPSGDSHLRAKIKVLKARWMNSLSRFDSAKVLDVFKAAHNSNPEWESAPYYIGRYQDERYKEIPSGPDRINRGAKLNWNTVKYYSKAVKNGSKYVYQAVPRMLTLWLDGGEDPAFAAHSQFALIMDTMRGCITTIPGFKWYTAFPQIISRVSHPHPEVWTLLEVLISAIIRESPQQGLWQFVSVTKSKKNERKQRGNLVINKLKADAKTALTELRNVIPALSTLASGLLDVCDFSLPQESTVKVLSVSKNFPQLQHASKSLIILPIQESLTVSLPAAAISDSDFQPFASNPPTFRDFSEDIDVMSSLAKPKKIVVQGTDGQSYPFLCKPKDDLRKDARLMDFNALINQIFKANSEARRRQLHVRTYAIVPLNEDSGILQWVPNTTPMRTFLLNLYKTRKNLPYWLPCMHETFKKIKARSKDSEAGDLFVSEVLPLFPPIFHEWFLEAFPEPSVWLARRLVFTRTAAVGSIIGWVLGLGDRHLENILIDVTSGDAIHIDFNCLFDRGKTLDVPERVPFRLTQNMVAAFGVTGYEGPFRIACEKSVGLFRTNKESLLSVLDAFLHDPLVEWEDQKRKQDRENRKPMRAGRDIPQGNQVKPSADLRTLAQRAVKPIEKRISGIYQPGSGPKEKVVEREIPIEGLVNILILEATDPNNLGAMYAGWAPWY